MKRLNKKVIGGIQSKVFNLSLLTILLLSAAFIIISVHSNNMLSRMLEETDEKQQETVMCIKTTAWK